MEIVLCWYLTVEHHFWASIHAVGDVGRALGAVPSVVVCAARFFVQDEKQAKAWRVCCDICRLQRMREFASQHTDQKMFYIWG